MAESAATVEIRGWIPRKDYDVVDAIKKGRGLTNDEVLTMIVAEFADRERRVATLITRLNRGNGNGSQEDRAGSGD